MRLSRSFGARIVGTPPSRWRISPTTAEKRGPGRCSSASPGRSGMGMSSRPARSRRGRWRWWSSESWMWRCRRSWSPTRGRRWRRLRPAFWGDPTAELQVVGVTGTNGKTTTAYLMREILEAAGIRRGLMGTVQAGGRRGGGGGRADDAGGDRPAGDVPADAGGGRQGLRDGGLLARDGAPPRRRDPLRRRRCSRT